MNHPAFESFKYNKDYLLLSTAVLPDTVLLYAEIASPS